MPRRRWTSCRLRRGRSSTISTSSLSPPPDGLDSGFRVAFRTLGCKVNQADSDHLATAFRAAGCTVVPDDQPADAYVVNTCTVTLVADRKARKLVRGLAAEHPGAVVAVTGCYTAGAGRALFEAMPEVEVVRGTRDRQTLPAAVLLELRRRRALGLLPPVVAAAAPRRVRAMLKVQDGCEHVCGYCIVPQVRGEHRSRPAAEVVAEARDLLAAGTRELVLCGIRLGAYGYDDPSRRGSRHQPLQDLLPRLAGLPGLTRLRLSSILPLDVGPDLFTLLADLQPVCEHLHLPLQSGDDTVLRAMRRGYTVRRFRELVDGARAALGDLALATDVLVGYPGETSAQFAATLDLVEALALADLHVFPYSRRPGTAAAALADDVPAAEKQARVAAMLALRGDLRSRFAARRGGRAVAVLVEEQDAAGSRGLTRDYLRVTVPGAVPLGCEVTVTAGGWDGEQLVVAPAAVATAEAVS